MEDDEDQAFQKASQILMERFQHNNNNNDDGSTETAEEGELETDEIVNELLSKVGVSRQLSTDSIPRTLITRQPSNDGSVLSNGSPNGSPRIEDELVLPETRLAALIQKLLTRERRHGVPPELQGGNTLARRLKTVFSFPPGKGPGWLWRPLFDGLMKGSPYIDTFVEPPTGGMPMPILAWLCQWKSIGGLFHWKGRDEMVSIALAAGADPNVKTKKGSTPVFFAVKYGSLETVKALANGGANFSLLDSRKRTCLWNALERPIPEIVSFLIDQLPATETFPYHPNGSKDVSYQSAVDYLFASQLSLSFNSESTEYPWSWQVLGRPKLEDIARVLIDFGRRGVTFTPNDITVDLLSFVLRGGDPNKRRNRYPNYHMAKLPLEKLAKMFMGLWLPELFKNEITPPCATDTQIICPSICKLCEMDGRAERLTLYCGHTFCLACIKAYGKINRYMSFCPECRKPLCKDLTGLSWKQRPSMEVLFEAEGGPYGPNALSSEQLKEECREWNIITYFRSDEKLRRKFSQSLPQPSPMPQVELNSMVPVTDGKDVNLLVPKDGPIVIPIKIQSIPVLAFVSTTACCTLVSPALVELFGFQKKTLTSSAFKSVVGGQDISHELTALTTIQFDIGGVNVRLDHALEATLPDCIGIQLGVDFLQSGVWCLVDVKLEGESVGQDDTYVTIDGYGHTMSSSVKKEELRYYGRDGSSFRTPLLHLQPFKDGAVTNSLYVRQESDFDECSWCCRIFPAKDMVHAACAYYCDESCQEQASKLQYR